MDSQAFGCKHLSHSISLSLLSPPSLIPSLFLSLSRRLTWEQSAATSYFFLPAEAPLIFVTHDATPPCRRPVPYPSCPPCPRHPLLHIARLGRSRHKAVVSNYLSGRIVDCPAKKKQPAGTIGSDQFESPRPRRWQLYLWAERTDPRGSSRCEVRFLPGDVTLRSASEMSLSCKEITFNYIKKYSFRFKYQYRTKAHSLYFRL